MKETFKKSRGNAGLDGVQFQLNLLTVFLLNALHNFSQFKISSENQDAAKFDDIVMELPDGSAVFLQAKFKINRKVSKEQLFSTNSKNTDFSLPKYFFEYLKIKTKFEVKTVIICTNADVDEKNLEDVLLHQNVHTESMLNYDECNYSLLTFKDTILNDLKENAEIYYDKNLKGKAIGRADITTENIKEFLSKLQFIFNYPGGPKLNMIIDQLLFRLNSLLGNTSHQNIYRKIEDWFKQRRGEYLTETRARAMFSEIKSDKYCESLENYNLLFEQNKYNFNDSKRIFQITAESGYLLPVLKVYRSLQNDESKKLYINSDDDINVQRQLLETFQLCHYVYLIIIWHRNDSANTEMCQKLKAILEEREYKKIIVVTNGNRNFVQQIGLNEGIVDLDGSVTFQEVSVDSKEALIKKRCINFQGKYTSLEELLKTETDYTKALNSEILEKLLKGEEIKVGVEPLDFDEGTTQYYISRSFCRKTDRMEDGKHTTEKKQETIPEQQIFEVDEKIIFIANLAGMGKSTVLTKLSLDIKQKYPDLWVVRINLNDCTTILRNSLRERKETITIMELLQIKNQLEKYVFNIKGKVVLLLDGVDEISPDYTKLILSLLTECRAASNFTKIIVTTRPHMTRELKGILKVKPFVLQPLSEQDQIDFLTTYWTHNLGLDDVKKERCVKYAKTLLRKMYSWTCIYDFVEYHFAAVPLQVRMLAETFQENIGLGQYTDCEGCREFLAGEAADPKLPEKVNANLYDLFLEKKRDAFIAKGNPSGNTSANKALNDQFNECLAYHRNVALEVMLDETQLTLFSTYRKGDEDSDTNLLKIGIVQKLQDNYYFVHRTYAEFFVAQIVLKELLQNRNAEFQRFFIDELVLKPKYMVIRGFLDNFLKYFIDSMSSDIFKNYYKSLIFESQMKYCMPDDDLIFILAKEGCVAILQLILKSINFRAIKHKEVCIIDFQRKIPGKMSIFRKFRKRSRNTLTFLKYVTKKAGVNIKDKHDWTPLHYASERGFLDMVKFLVNEGANVNSLNDIDGIPLHLAVRWGKWDTVKYLVEQGSEINLRNALGCAPLHLAALWDNLDAVKFLVDHGADVNIKNSGGGTPLYLTSQRGLSDTAKFLIERGADVHIKIDNGKTLLHFFAEKDDLETVKFLVKCKLQIDVVDHSGNTALHLAARWGRSNIVKFLLEQGADFNIKNKDGYTAFHLAVQWNWLNTVKFFVEQGASVHIKDG